MWTLCPEPSSLQEKSAAFLFTLKASHRSLAGSFFRCSVAIVELQGLTVDLDGTAVGESELAEARRRQLVGDLLLGDGLRLAVHLPVRPLHDGDFGDGQAHDMHIPGGDMHLQPRAVELDVM